MHRLTVSSALLVFVASTISPIDAAEPLAGPADPAVAPAAPAVQVAARARPSVSVEGADAGRRGRVDEALAQFDFAGLSLPDVVIVFSDDASQCQGHDGLFQRRQTPYRILICNDAGYVVTHELAHAWEAANLDDAEREAYVEYRALSTWNSTDVAWRARAVEDVAFTIQQNLTTSAADLDSQRWIERIAAYEFLTGLPSPRTL